MKTSNKLLLGLFGLILISLITINIIIKIVINNEPTKKEKLSIINNTSGKSLLICSTDVFFTINKNTTIADINNYKAKLKEVNIYLNINKIEYDTNNKIKLLNISVNGNDGFSSFGVSSETSFDNDYELVFYKNNDKNIKSSFGLHPRKIKSTLN